MQHQYDAMISLNRLHLSELQDGYFLYGQVVNSKHEWCVFVQITSQLWYGLYINEHHGQNSVVVMNIPVTNNVIYKCIWQESIPRLVGKGGQIKTDNIIHFQKIQFPKERASVITGRSMREMSNRSLLEDHKMAEISVTRPRPTNRAITYVRKY